MNWSGFQLISPQNLAKRILSLKGTLVPYDPTSNPYAPSILGFNAGIYYDGSSIYPGTASSNCIGQNPAPSRITTTNRILGPGGYCTCGSAPLERFDDKTANFYLAHSKMQWVKVNQTTFWNVPGIIGVTSLYTMWIGRINITFTNGTFQQIGKVYAGTLFYRDPRAIKELTTNSTYEILACLP